MDTKLAKFRALTQVFDPIYRPLESAAGGVDPSYVPEAHEGFRAQLAASLELNPNAKLLIAGQPGCGKTTLLLSVAAELRANGRVVAFVDLETHTAIQDLGTPEMHLAAAAALLREAEAASRSISPSALGACSKWLVSVGQALPEERPGALADGIQRILAAARVSSDIRRELRDSVKQASAEDPYQLLALVLKDLSAERPVVILDGLDKLPPDQARDFFLSDSKKPMVDAPCAAILTIPLSIVYEPAFNVLGERYNNADNAVLPAIRLYDFNDTKRAKIRSERGFDLLRRIVATRIAPIDPDIIDTGAVDRAIEGSGGNIRALARLLQASIVKATVRKCDRIETLDVEAAIADQRESYRRAYQPAFLPVLRKVRDELQLDNTDDVGKLMLYGLWVVEYRNGITWYCLPVAVEALLDRLDRPKK